MAHSGRAVAGVPSLSTLAHHVMQDTVPSPATVLKQVVFDGLPGRYTHPCHSYEQAHSQCTESFYRKAVEDQIRTEPNSTVEDRRQMMEMLKRLEEDNEGIIEGSAEDAEEGDLSLSSRLAQLNMGEHCRLLPLRSFLFLNYQMKSVLKDYGHS